MKTLRRALLKKYETLYNALRPLLFRTSAQHAHERLMSVLNRADDNEFLWRMADFMHKTTFEPHSLVYGGITLSHHLILAAGFIKGLGFETEDMALTAVENGDNIIPGWRVIPRLVGLTEFGSYTRYPRLGNLGEVMWRDVPTRSTQNRVGLKNPGVQAAALFLERHIHELPYQFGINIAVSPGVEDLDQQCCEIEESLNAFLKRRVIPNWFTLNVSCPNTEDDPNGHQTETHTKQLCQAAQHAITSAGFKIPLWVKLSPGLAEAQYRLLMRVMAECDVKAVIATNTLPAPAPHQPSLNAGIGGGKLHQAALNAAAILQYEKLLCGYPVDVIGCGGILDGDSYLRYLALGIPVVQYWSALVYRGPLAAAIIESERP